MVEDNEGDKPSFIPLGNDQMINYHTEKIDGVKFLFAEVTAEGYEGVFLVEGTDDWIPQGLDLKTGVLTVHYGT